MGRRVVGLKGQKSVLLRSESVVTGKRKSRGSQEEAVFATDCPTVSGTVALRQILLVLRLLDLDSLVSLVLIIYQLRTMSAES